MYRLNLIEYLVLCIRLSTFMASLPNGFLFVMAIFFFVTFDYIFYVFWCMQIQKQLMLYIIVKFVSLVFLFG